MGWSVQGEERLTFRYGFQNLLVWLLADLVVTPFLEGLSYVRILLSVFLTMVLFSAVYAINREGVLFKWAVGLLAVTLALIWLDLLKILSFSDLASRALIVVYLGVLIYAFTRYIFAARIVNSRYISAALCVYLLLGILWAAVYDILETVAPGSFQGALVAAADGTNVQLQHFVYFSFVTLTTLGYGDILPQTSQAAGLCVVEAVVGQFFLAVLVARLVGIEVAQKFSVAPCGRVEGGGASGKGSPDATEAAPIARGVEGKEE